MDKGYDTEKVAEKRGYTDSIEETATSIAALDRKELTRRIMTYKGRFKLDLTEEYLKGLSVNRLRHLYLAALINNLNNSNDLESRAD